jgi:histidine decarboxylase
MKKEKNSTQKKSYWTPAKIKFEDFQLSRDKMNPDQYNRALKDLKDYATVSQRFFLGYQATQKMDFKHLSDYLNVSLNNIGDSFSDANWESPSVPPDGYFTMNDKWMERAVLDYYARLWNAKSPRLVKEDNDPSWLETYWGYVVSMGSTEGNILAMRNGRDYLNGTLLQYDPKQFNNGIKADESPVNRSLHEVGYGQAVASKQNPNALTPVLFFSDATHYSIKKLAQVLQLKSFEEIAVKEGYKNPYEPNGKWPKLIPTKKDGAIDVDMLVKYASFFIEKGYPIIVNFNYGTTWTGAYDNVALAVEKLIVVLKKHRMYERTIIINGKEYRRSGFWFHVDGALGAAMVPFLKMGESLKEQQKSVFPEFDFKLEIQSISMSGHKWIGIPWPCGIYMTKNKYLISNDVPSYVGSLDSTLAGSRNGMSSLLMWDYIAQRSYDNLKQEAKNALLLAEFAERELIKLYNNERVYRAPGSLAVIFPKPKNIELVKKYALASSGDFSHLFIMRHVTEGLILSLINDLKKNDSMTNESPSSTDLSQGW